MKRILLIAALLLIGGCDTIYSSQTTKQSAPAQAAPNSLELPGPAPIGPEVAAQPVTPVAVAALPGQQGTAPAAMPAVKVALLAPLSGTHQKLGQGLLQAAQLALFDMGYTAFELMPQDTKGTPEGAAAAAQAAINGGAQLILGPLLSQETRAAKAVVSRHNVSMIAFTTDWTLAGNNTYIMGFVPFSQVERVMTYTAQKGLQRIAIVAPHDEYGNAVVASYTATAQRLRLPPAEILRIPPNQADLTNLLRGFTKYDARMGTLRPQIQALESRLAQNPNDAQAMTQLSALKKQIAVNTPFDAVLLPVAGEQARSIADLLGYYELGPQSVKRLGTGLWDDAGLAADPDLAGAWFAAPAPDQRRSFERRYFETYASSPPRLATLAYDATALAAILAQNGFKTQGRPAFDQQSLMNPNGFAGIDGIFRFRPDGVAERGLAVLEYRAMSIVTTDPAPRTFQTPRQ